MTQRQQPRTPEVGVDLVTELAGADLHDLCDAAEAAIDDGGGFGWLRPPERQVMEAYWRGILLVPEREFFAARLDGVIAGSAQLHRAARNNEAQAFVGQLSTFFLAPWARGHGLARRLVEAVEARAVGHGLKVITLDVRASQDRAIQLYEAMGYQRWGSNPYYALINDAWVPGYFYHKRLNGNGNGVQRLGGARS